jgi:hypothetical protein
MMPIVPGAMLNRGGSMRVVLILVLLASAVFSGSRFQDSTVTNIEFTDSTMTVYWRKESYGKGPDRIWKDVYRFDQKGIKKDTTIQAKITPGVFIPEKVEWTDRKSN